MIFLVVSYFTLFSLLLPLRRLPQLSFQVYIYFVLRLNVDDIFFTFYIPPWMTIEYFSTAFFLRCSSSHRSLTQHDFSEDSAIPFCTFLTALQHNRVDRLCSSASLKFEKLHTKQHRWEFDDVISLKILISLFSLAIFFISSLSLQHFWSSCGRIKYIW